MSTPAPFLFVGNHPALDFVNTEIVEVGAPRDLLTGLPDLVRWLEQAGMLEAGMAASALARWRGTRTGETVLARARELRTALRRAADAVARGRPLPRASVEAINALLARGTGVNRVVSGAGGYVVRRTFRLEAPADLLVPVAEAAADLLCHADLRRVRRCAHPQCVLYFLDGTKNGTRRWCDMRGCGNRVNAAAYYRRRRAQPTAP